MDRRQHVSQPENARLRCRRHSFHARVAGSGRKVRRSECALRGPSPCRRPSRARCLRHPRRQIRIGLQEPGRFDRDHHKIAALPRRSLPERFWLGPGDPADVRKGVLEEPPGNRRLDDDIVKRARARLFGSWEMNWMAYNFAHDVALPGSNGGPIGFLMYPQAETAEGRLHCLDPDNFQYQITSKETTATKT